jgi:hypothetical protein
MHNWNKCENLKNELKNWEVKNRKSLSMIEHEVEGERKRGGEGRGDGAENCRVSQ